ncbi:MAG: FG-GAP repeat protein [Phycisphaerales bacterium]|nr:FG-GAP repeat protein [Phycisphaerales bacterium]
MIYIVVLLGFLGALGLGGAVVSLNEPENETANVAEPKRGIPFKWTQSPKTTETTLIIYDLGLPEEGVAVGIPSSSLAYRNDDVHSPFLVEYGDVAFIPGHRYQWHVAAINPMGYSLSKPATFIIKDKVIEPIHSGDLPQVYKLLAVDGGHINEGMGSSVALDGEIAVVGGQGHGTEHGRAWIFKRVGSRWIQLKRIYSFGGHAGEGYACSVALKGSLIAVGALDNNTSGHDGSGVVYLYRDYSTPAQTQWSHEITLYPDEPKPGARFGASVSISGDTVIVGAPGERAAYVFEYKGTHWDQIARLILSGDGDAMENGKSDFGASVAIDGERIVVGSPRVESSQDNEAGAGYVFRLGDQGWTQSDKLTAPLSAGDPAQGDGFGMSVALWQDTVVIGAISAWNSAKIGSGVAYVFEYSSAGQWEMASRLENEGCQKGDEFGRSVSISKSAVVVGAQCDHGNNQAGSAYTFSRDDTGWHSVYRLYSNVGHSGDRFGMSVAISGDTVLCGAPMDDEKRINQGSASVHELIPLGSD